MPSCAVTLILSFVPGKSVFSEGSSCTVGCSSILITEPVGSTFTSCCCSPSASACVGGFLITDFTLSGSLLTSGNVMLAPFAAIVNIVPFTVMYS